LSQVRCSCSHRWEVSLPDRSSCRALGKLVRNFRSDTKGNVAIIFGLLLIPVIGFAGAAIDYSRANSARAALQSALDAAALMLAKEAPALTPSERTKKANDYFRALFTRQEALNTELSATYDSSMFVLTLTAVASVNTSLLKVLGRQKFDIATSSSITAGMTRLRVALVLDNTGSMSSSGKMSALKTATKNLLSTLQSAAKTNGDVYVSVIPFSKDVNVGPLNYNASWIDWTEWDAKNGQWCKKNGQCDDTQSANSVWTPNSQSTWNGCVTDRTQNYDTQGTPPASANVQTLFPAEQYDKCPVALKSLSHDWSGMNMLVDSMYPDGNTNQAIGLAWGWISLMQTAPLNALALDPTYKYQQIIILLSDGLNTQNRWFTDQAQIDARQQILCGNVKAGGISLYTVQVNTGGDPTSTLLKNCASSPDKFFLLTSAGQIISTFNQIGMQLTRLHISK
jgi:Flp pilus assembly protein TadG